MYTSDIKRPYAKAAICYGAATVITALFSAIYEHFSFGVYSNMMIFSAAVPFTLGVIPALLIMLTETYNIPKIARVIHRLSVATLTTGMIFSGVIEIYGTDSPLSKYYFIASAIMTSLSLAIWIVSMKKKDNRCEK